MATFEKLKNSARQLKAETFALYLAAHDPRTPWYAKVLIAVVVAYALSPIDLIPDFVPVLGYLDDLVLIPLGISLAIKLLQPELMTACREQARHTLEKKPVNYWAAAVIVMLWLALAALSAQWAYAFFKT